MGNEEKYQEKVKDNHLTLPPDYKNSRNRFRNVQGKTKLVPVYIVSVVC